MIIRLDPKATPEQVKAVQELVSAKGHRQVVHRSKQQILVSVDDHKTVSPPEELFVGLAGVVGIWAIKVSVPEDPAFLPVPGL